MAAFDLATEGQIQRVNCGWIDWTLEDEQELRIEIEYVEDEVTQSKDIFFVQFPRGLCFPFERRIKNHPMFGIMFKMLIQQLNAKQRIVEETGDHYLGLYVMPIQRFFHRTRIHQFDVIPYEQVLNDLPTPKEKRGVE